MQNVHKMISYNPYSMSISFHSIVIYDDEVFIKHSGWEGFDWGKPDTCSYHVNDIFVYVYILHTSTEPYHIFQ